MRIHFWSPGDVLHPYFLIGTRVAMTIGQPIARSSQDLFWLRLTGYSEHWLQHVETYEWLEQGCRIQLPLLIRL
jgi:hypothetical protein